MSTKRKNRIATGQNGTPAAPAEAWQPTAMRQWTLKERLERDAAKADAELARRVDEREQLGPFVETIASLLCSLESAGKIYDVKLKHFEPGEYGDSEATYPQRIQFSWSVKDYDHQYSESPDFSITLMGGYIDGSF